MVMKIGPGVTINPTVSGVSGATNNIVINPIPLSAPTITSITTASTSSVTVSFTSPTSTGGIPIIQYTAISSPSSITASSASSPITVTGLTAGQTYTFTVTAYNGFGAGPASSPSNNIKLPTTVVSSSTSYTTPGAYSWIAPTCTSVSVVAVGGGGGGYAQSSYLRGSGSGAGLGYINNYSVTSGTSYTVVVGAGGVGTIRCTNTGGEGGDSYFVNTSTVMGGHGPGWYNVSVLGYGVFVGCGGSYGGPGHSLSGNWYAGGGGAGGYAGGGGGGGGFSSIGAASGGHCGAGGGGFAYSGGGGVGIFGQGTNGIAGCSSGVRGGGGGSGGSAGSTAYGSCYPGCKSLVGNGGAYGGGGGAGSLPACGGYPQSTSGGNGAVRIVWPGNTRQFPSTCVGTP